MNQERCSLSGLRCVPLVTSTSSAKGVLVCIATLPLITRPSSRSLTTRTDARSFSSSRKRKPTGGPPLEKVRKRPVRALMSRWAALALLVGRVQHYVLPLRVEVAVVPLDVRVHHALRQGVSGDVIDGPRPEEPHLSPVPQSFAVLRSRTHGPLPSRATRA